MSKPMTTPFNRFWRKFDFNITQRLKGFKFLGIVGGFEVTFFSKIRW